MKKLEATFKVVFYAMMGVAIRMTMGIIASVFKAGTMAMVESFQELVEPQLRVNHYLQEWILAFEIPQFLLEGSLMMGGLYLIELLLASKKPELLRKHMKGKNLFIVFGCSVVGLEIVSFLASLLQFVGNDIGAAVTSQEMSVVIRNRISWERWLRIDYLLRMWEGILLTLLVSLRNRWLVAIYRRNQRRLKKERKEANKMASISSQKDQRVFQLHTLR